MLHSFRSYNGQYSIFKSKKLKAVFLDTVQSFASTNLKLIMVQFCYLILHLGTETDSKCLLKQWVRKKNSQITSTKP